MLTLENVSVNYGAIEALTDITLHDQSGRSRHFNRRERRGENDDSAHDHRFARTERRARDVRRQGNQRNGDAQARADGNCDVARRSRRFCQSHRARKSRNGRVYPQRQKRYRRRYGTRLSRFFRVSRNAKNKKPERSPAANSRCSRWRRAMMSRPRLLLLDEPILRTCAAARAHDFRSD